MSRLDIDVAEGGGFRRGVRYILGRRLAVPGVPVE
jgi:hypothetical protein